MKAIPFTRAEFERAVGRPLEEFSADCHAAALSLVRTGVLGPDARVARGSTPGVPGQHSWVAVGDPYEETVPVVDPTLWSYAEDVEGVWTGLADERPHVPHGAGMIWKYGKPAHQGGETVTVTVDGLSRSARDFLDLLGPLDYKGWAQLAHAPVGGWPAGEILAVMYDDERLSALIPIDVVGMATDRNPQGLYF